MTVESWAARVLAAPGAKDRIRAIEAELRQAVAQAREVANQDRGE